MENPNVRELLEHALKSMGYDGLYSELDGCGCGIDDLCPCNELSTHCQAGYKCQLDKTDCEGLKQCMHKDKDKDKQVCINEGE